MPARAQESDPARGVVSTDVSRPRPTKNSEPMPPAERRGLPMGMARDLLHDGQGALADERRQLEMAVT